jgi:hypothetical protein
MNTHEEHNVPPMIFLQDGPPTFAQGRESSWALLASQYPGALDSMI